MITFFPPNKGRSSISLAKLYWRLTQLILNKVWSAKRKNLFEIFWSQPKFFKNVFCSLNPFLQLPRFPCPWIGFKSFRIPQNPKTPRYWNCIRDNILMIKWIYFLIIGEEADFGTFWRVEKWCEGPFFGYLAIHLFFEAMMPSATTIMASTLPLDLWSLEHTCTCMYPSVFLIFIYHLSHPAKFSSCEPSIAILSYPLNRSCRCRQNT